MEGLSGNSRPLAQDAFFAELYFLVFEDREAHLGWLLEEVQNTPGPPVLLLRVSKVEYLRYKLTHRSDRNQPVSLRQRFGVQRRQFPLGAPLFECRCAPIHPSFAMGE
jgi:hypothetical protein